MAREEKKVRAEKVQAVDELAEKLTNSNLVVLADYRGLTVADIGSLRRKLREQGVEFRVAKNTLTGFAADKAGKPALKSALVGPNGFAFGSGDESAMAKALSDYERTSKVFKIKGGLLGQRLITAAQVASLSSMPPKEVLLSQALAGFQAPISGFVGVLSGVLTAFVGTLEARRRQLEEQEAPAAS